MPLWTQGEGLTWAEVTCPALSLSPALLSWRCGPACPNSLPAQTHRPHPGPAACGAGQTPQAQALDLRKSTVNLKQKGQLADGGTDSVGRGGPRTSASSHGEAISQASWVVLAGHHPTGVHSMRPSWGQAQHFCHFSLARTCETHSIVGSRTPAQERGENMEFRPGHRTTALTHPATRVWPRTRGLALPLGFCSGPAPSASPPPPSPRLASGSRLCRAPTPSTWHCWDLCVFGTRWWCPPLWRRGVILWTTRGAHGSMS